MPTNSANKCFVTNKHQPKFGSDYTNQKREKEIYKYYSGNTQLPGTITKQDGSKYNGPFFLDLNGCLNSVGGYNTKNYDLLLDITKGKYYSYNNTSCDGNSKSLTPNQSFKISEGPFFYNTDISNNSTCNIALENHFDLSYVSQFPIEELTNFDFPTKINIS